MDPVSMKVMMNKLGDMLTHEYTLVLGVHGDIQFINDELASMRGFLDNFNRREGDSNNDEQMREWVRQIRDVAYDIEDCIDNVSYRLGREPLKDDCIYYLRKLWHYLTTLYARHSIASEIQKLKIRARDVGERRIRYGVTTGPNPADPSKAICTSSAEPQVVSIQPTPGPQLVDVIEPARMKSDITKLGRWLTQRDRQLDSKLKILAIAGIDSLGKTTLAVALYNRFGPRFDCRALVQASQRYDRAALLRSMLTQVMQQVPDDTSDQQGGGGGGSATSANPIEGIEGWKEKQIQEKLDSYLAQKRYFLLIDDIWTVQAWEDIWKSLPKSNSHNGPGGVIVVTTRLNSVADVCFHQQVGGTYKHIVGKLSSDESRTLLFERIFGKGITIPLLSQSKANDKDNNNILENILEKYCGGLPLAIVAIAGYLASKLTAIRNADEKEKPEYTNLTFDPNRWEKACNFLKDELEKNPSPENLTKILDVCSNDFPADHKTCLLYLSIFPRGCSISRKRLIRRWVAEGFITEKHGKSAEEVAEECFNALISRNIIRCVDSSSNGKAKTCQVYDMILEYIVSKSSEENFTTVVGGHWPTPAPRDRVRRLSIHSFDHGQAKAALQSLRLSHVRSLSAFQSLKHLPNFSFKFQILQMLDLEGCKGLSKRHLSGICQMFHLKFLSLRKTDIKALPKKIRYLQYLEMLDIRETNVRELPTEVELLKRLAHLLCGNKISRLAVKLPHGVTKMAALQTLSGIEINASSSSKVLDDMQSLTRVKKLSIYNLEGFGEGNKSDDILRSAIEGMISYSLVSLAVDDGFTGFLHSLHYLSTTPKYLRSLELSGKLLKVPEWISCLGQLTKLVLSIMTLSTDTLTTVGKLNTLFSLTFSLHASKLNKAVLDRIHENTMNSDGEIIVPVHYEDEDHVNKKLFPSLRLLRFSAPVIPLLSFQEDTMKDLQRLELRFRTTEGIYGLDKLKNLQQVVFGISRRAPQVAKEKVSQIKTFLSNHTNVTVIDEMYHE